MSDLKRLEVVKFGPFRFIGKSVYASNARGKDELCDYMLKQSWVFDRLDKLHEYATEETHNFGVLHWEAYGYHEDNPKVDNLFYGPTELFGYTVGRFFKPDTPVPGGLNYIDMSEMYVAKAWLKANPGDTHGDIDFGLVRDTVNKTIEYNHNFTLLTAETYCVNDEDGELVNGYYIACVPVSEEKQKIKKIEKQLIENFEQGFAALDKELIEDSATLSEMLNDVAIELKGQGEYDKALALYEKALAVDPNQNIQHFIRHGVTYQLMENYEKANEFYTKGLAALDKEIINDSTALSEMLNDVAFELRQQKEYDEALVLYEKALAVDPNQNDAHYSRHGVTYQLMGNHEKAIELFTKGLEMGKSRGSRLDRGISYFALGKIAEAVSDYHALRAQLEEENDSDWKHLSRLYELVKEHL